MASIHNLTLEGDGLVENLYQYLWTKDELDDGPRICIPDTVVYKYRQPAAWYFTSVDGSIKKKHKANLINVRIEEAFLRKQSGSDIVAYYISTSHASKETDRVTTIEYLTEETFREFLYQRTKVNNGVLQRFVEPKGIHNSMTRVIWSPKVCMLERRCNRLKLHDTRLPIYQRAVTYDGEEHNSTTVPVRGSRLPAEVQRICESVVSHVAEVSFQKFKISRMVMNLKIDPAGKIWLLWCSSLRVDGVAHERSSSPGSSRTPMLKLPSRHAHLIKPPSKRGPLDIGMTVTVPKNVRLTNISNPSTWASDGPDGPAADVKKRRKARAASRSGSRGSRRDSKKRRKKKKRRRAEEDEAMEAVDPMTDLCPSCGNRADIDHMYDVQYKTVVQHYEQLLMLLGLRPLPQRNEEDSRAMSPATLPRECVWPPQSLARSAAGGVGVYGLYPDVPEPSDSEDNDEDAKRRAKPAIVKAIPTLLAACHPKLTEQDYRRYRRDPLFLYKTLNVCEDCYLVYADVACNVMQGMEAGSAVHSVMGRRAADASRRRNVPLPVVQGARYSRLRARERAEKAHEAALRGDVLDLPSAGASTRGSTARSFYPNQYMPPAVPRPVPVSDVSGIASTIRTQLTGGDVDELPPDIGSELASRQHSFYAQLSQNPNLHKGHPLAHLVQTYNGPSHGSGAGTSKPGTAPTQHSRSAPAIHRDTYTAPSMAEQHMMTPGTVGHFSTMPGPRAGFQHSSSSPSLAKIRARGGATLLAYNAPPANDEELLGRSGPPVSKGYSPGSSTRSRRKGKRRSKRSTHGPSSGSHRTADGDAYGTSASKHQEFLDQMTQDVKTRLSDPPLLEGVGEDELPSKKPARSKSSKKLSRGTSKPSWREAKEKREQEKRKAEAEEEAVKERARKGRQAAYKQRLKQREKERSARQANEEEAAAAAAQRAEEEKKARQAFRRKKKKHGGSAKALASSNLRPRPAEPRPDPSIRKEGRKDYRSVYDAASAEADKEIAAIRGGDMKDDGEDEPVLCCATPWKIGGVRTVVNAELLVDPSSLADQGVEVVDVDDAVAVDVSAFYWQRPRTGAQVAAKPFSGTQSALGAAPTHDPANFSRGIIRLDVHDTVSELHFSVAIRIVVFAKPPHPSGEEDITDTRPIEAPLPHVVLLSRVLESCYFEHPPATSTHQDSVVENRLLVDTDFIAAEAANPSDRHRPIMCHARKFGDDMVIVSLHTVEPRPGTGDVESQTSPRFVLQAYNYTKRKFIAANLTQQQLLESNKPFLKQAAQVYFSNLENRPATPAQREA